MRSFTTLLILATAALTSAQQINPTSVPIATREFWCKDQRANCPLLCLQETNPASASTRSNTCDASSLAYTCVCANGLQPNVSQYSQTVPFYTCQEFGNQCVAACGLSNNACASDCRQKNLCGAQNPTRVNATSTSSTATAAATGSSSTGATLSSFGGSGSSSAGGNTKSAGVSVLDLGRSYGVVALAGGLFGAFALVL